MTRKDYELIARILDGQSIMCPPESITGLDRTLFMLGAADQKAFYVRAFANALASDNPRFDRDRFLKACGVAV